LAEAGDFLLAREEGAVADDHILGEIGEVLEGKIPGRRSDAEITLFKSLGIAVEDLAAGMQVYRKAVAAEKGDAPVAREREGEPRESIEDVRHRLQTQGKLSRSE